MSFTRPAWMDEPQTQWPDTFREVYERLSEHAGGPVAPDDIVQWVTLEEPVVIALERIHGRHVSRDEITAGRDEILRRLLGA